MIIQILEQAKGYIEQYYQALSDKNRYQLYITNLSNLNLQINLFTNCLSMVCEVVEKDISMILPLDPGDQQILLGALRDCEEKIEYMLELRSDNVKTLENIIGNIIKSYNNRWHQAARDYAGGLPELLENVGVIMDNPTKAKDLKVRIEEHYKQMPKSKQKLKDFVDIVKESQDIITQMNVDAEIRIFLGKLGSQQATVRDLTNHVMKWIRDGQLEGKMSIGFKQIR